MTFLGIKCERDTSGPDFLEITMRTYIASKYDFFFRVEEKDPYYN